MPLHGMRRHRKRLRPVAEINLTSLLDVAFVLLIAFMIVAPSLKYGVELKLPAVREGAPQLPAGELSIATIAIPREFAQSGSGVRTFMLDGDPVDTAELESRLKEKKSRIGDKLTVEIQADRQAPYEAFVQAVAAVRRSGVEAVGLPVDAAQQAPAADTQSHATPQPSQATTSDAADIPARAVTQPPAPVGQ